MNKRTTIFLSFATLSLFIASCKKDSGPSTPVYTVPTTYNFVNFNDTNQLKLLAMADQIGVKINLANTIPGTVVSAQQLKDMFNNVNNYFVDSALKLNSSGLRLADYCSPAAKADGSFVAVSTVHQAEPPQVEIWIDTINDTSPGEQRGEPAPPW